MHLYLYGCTIGQSVAFRPILTARAAGPEAHLYAKAPHSTATLCAVLCSALPYFGDQVVALTCEKRASHAAGHNRPTFPRKHGSQSAKHPSRSCGSWFQFSQRSNDGGTAI